MRRRLRFPGQPRRTQITLGPDNNLWITDQGQTRSSRSILCRAPPTITPFTPATVNTPRASRQALTATSGPPTGTARSVASAQPVRRSAPKSRSAAPESPGDRQGPRRQHVGHRLQQPGQMSRLPRAPLPAATAVPRRAPGILLGVVAGPTARSTSPRRAASGPARSTPMARAWSSRRRRERRDRRRRASRSGRTATSGTPSSTAVRLAGSPRVSASRSSAPGSRRLPARASSRAALTGTCGSAKRATPGCDAYAPSAASPSIRLPPTPGGGGGGTTGGGDTGGGTTGGGTTGTGGGSGRRPVSPRSPTSS